MRSGTIGEPKVGIVLATFNPNPDFFAQQIESIKKQTHKNWICYVQDDLSNEAYESIIRSNIDSDHRFVYQQNLKNIGVYHNFEKGIRAILTENVEYIALSDQDDIWEENKLEVLVEAISENPNIKLVHSDARIIDSNNKRISESLWQIEKRRIDLDSPVSLIYRNIVTGCTTLFCTELAHVALPFPVQGKKVGFHHDLWLALCATTIGKIKPVHSTLVNYREHGHNVVGPSRTQGLDIFRFLKLSSEVAEPYFYRIKVAEGFHRICKSSKEKLLIGLLFNRFPTFGVFSFFVAFYYLCSSYSYFRTIMGMAVRKFHFSILTPVLLIKDRSYQKKEVRPAHKLIGNSSYTLMGMFLPSILGLLVIPSLIKNMGLSSFAVLSFSWVFVSYVMILELGAGKAITQSISEALSQKKEKSLEWVGSALLILLSINAVVSGLLYYFSPYLVDKVFQIPEGFEEETKLSIQYVALFMTVINVTAVFKGVLEAFGNFRQSNFVQLGIGVGNFLIPGILCFFGVSASNLVLGIMISRVLALTILFFYAAKYLPLNRGCLNLRRPELFKLFKFSGWIGISYLVIIAMVYLDRFVLAYFLPITLLVYISTPFEIIHRANMLPFSIAKAILPYFSYLRLNKPQSLLRSYVLSVHGLYLILFPLLFFIGYFSMELVKVWLGEDFSRKSYGLVTLVSLGVLLNTMYHLPMTHLQSIGKASTSGKIHLMMIPVHIIIAVVAIQKFGLEGAAAAWGIRSFIESGALVYGSRKHLPENNRMLELFLTQCSLAIVAWSFVFLNFSGYYKMFIFLTLMLVYFFLYWNKVISKWDRLRILKRLRVKEV
ncbi:MAG: glycosyltransferase [Bdellovibrionales bacterium]|nr:glycosyltransferase [Bdellovibrionales bacterium]